MEYITEKVCPNCGEKLPWDAAFCVKCGTKIGGNESSIEQVAEAPSSSKKSNKKIVIGAVVAVAAVVAVVFSVLFIVKAVQASNLKKIIEREWYRVEGEDGSYILCILDFSDGEIEYRVETGYSWLDTTIATFDYKVISGNEIKILRYGDHWETIKIEFNDDKTAMIATPAITSVDSMEIWVNVD